MSPCAPDALVVVATVVVSAAPRWLDEENAGNKNAATERGFFRLPESLHLKKSLRTSDDEDVDVDGDGDGDHKERTHETPGDSTDNDNENATTGAIDPIDQTEANECNCARRLN